MPESPSEIEVLRGELKTLRKEIALLRQVINIETDEQGRPFFVNISCHRLGLMNPDGWRGSCGQLLATEHGGVLTLWRHNEDVEKEKVLVGFVEETPAFVITGADGHPVTEMSTKAESGGFFAAYSSGGVPRALVKAKSDGGAFTLTHPDGRARATFLSAEKSVELLAWGKESKPVIQLLSTVEGGVLRLSDDDGELRAVLGAAGGAHGVPKHGALMVDGGKAQLLVKAQGDDVLLDMSDSKYVGDPEHMGCRVQLGTNAKGSTLAVTGPDPTRSIIASATEGVNSLFFTAVEGQRASFQVFCGKETGYLSLAGPDGSAGVEITTSEAANALSLRHPKTSVSGVILESGDKASQVCVTDGKTIDPLAFLKVDNNGACVGLRAHAGVENLTHLSALHEGSALELIDTENIKHLTAVTSPEGGSFAIRNELGVERAVIGIFKDGGALKLNWGGTPAVLAAATDRGGLITVFDEDGDPHAFLPDQEGLPDDEE